MTRRDEVSETLAALRAGGMTVDEVAERFAARTWPSHGTAEIDSYDDFVAATLDDLAVPPPGSFFEVSCAYVDARLTDTEYEKLVVAIAGAGGEVWWPERAALHKQTVQGFLDLAAESVPRNGRALLVGGLPGSGKPAVLAAADVNLDNYLFIAPSIVEDVMAERGLIPHVEGLSPLEASPLVHLEAAEIALMVAFCAMRQRYNLLWDLTMSRAEPVEDRIAAMRDAGYDGVDALFADVDVESAIARLTDEYEHGMAEYRRGVGYGARSVPADLLRTHASCPDVL